MRLFQKPMHNIFQRAYPLMGYALFSLGGIMEAKEVNQIIKLINRRILTIDAVISVSALGDNYIDIDTKGGAITVEGENLKIEDLNNEKGTLQISGKIDTVSYNTSKKTNSIFTKHFK